VLRALRGERIFNLGNPARFTLLASAFAAALIAAGCSGTSVSIPPATGAEESVRFAPGTLTFPEIDSYTESFSIASASPSSGVTGAVIASVAAPAELPSIASGCTPSAITNPLLYMSFKVSASVTVVPGSLVITLPPSVSNAYTFYQEFGDVTNPSPQCPELGTVSGQNVTFANSSGNSTTLSPSDTYEIVLFHT
jgi:hypothetical protein